MSSPAFEEIVETFEFLDDWEDRYRHVIELGRDMPEMAEAQKTALTKVDGCASQVWIAPELAEGRLRFVGDSDAMIVRGLIAILRAMLNDRAPEEILGEDIEAGLSRLGLDQHLSRQRSNGLMAMVARLRDLASRAEAQAE